MGVMVIGVVGCGSDSGGGEAKPTDSGGAASGGMATGGASGQGGQSGEPTAGGTASSGGAAGMDPTATGGTQNPLLTKRCTTDDVCDADEFCRDATDDSEGFCVAGCREGGCEEGQLCDSTSRICVRDKSCADNSGCRGVVYG